APARAKPRPGTRYTPTCYPDERSEQRRIFRERPRRMTRRRTLEATMQRVWFITGASSGFGRALAEAVLRRGDGAVLAARRIAALESVSAPNAQSALALRQAGRIRRAGRKMPARLARKARDLRARDLGPRAFRLPFPWS